MAKILIIEDEFWREQDAKKFFESRPDVEVIYASNYSDASRVMFDSDKETYQRIKGNIDGVISDIFFPLTPYPQWNRPEPIGVMVAVELSQFGIPFVLNIAGYLHKRRYEWINQLARGQGWKIIDTGWEHDTDSKNWERAYQSLEEKMRR